MGVISAKDQPARRASAPPLTGWLAPRASSALSNEPEPSMRSSSPSCARACQAASSAVSPGTMCLRMNR
ncbi:Uncharacterised protein [Bordetella pertussis]|nr:Uncharacterised protein [Bordetella pertussis]